MRHFNIPLFIPEKACPFQCIFCDQRKITGVEDSLQIKEFETQIINYLSTIPTENSSVLLAFFGGTFTGISLKEQEEYLQMAKPFIDSGQIAGIRISTRPDYINQENLDLLKRYHVSNIELGAQSLNNEVLRQSYRGHTYQQVAEASKLILNNGFELGLQMMLGLPGDTKKTALQTAEHIIALGATETRIYPTMVIHGTALEQLWRKGKYNPISTEKAIEQSVELFQLFEENKVRVLRMGLYPSEDFLNNEVVAGPEIHHFKEKVMSRIWGQKFMPLIQKASIDSSIIIYVSPLQLNFAIGYKASNKLMLNSYYKKVKIKSDTKLQNYNYRVDYY